MQVLATAPWRHSFTRALDFTAEALMPAWDPLGRDFIMYTRVADARVEWH